MTASLMPLPQYIALGATNGVFGHLVGAKIYTYEAGTTTPKATYTTAVGDVANANPVICDARGEARIFLGAGQYRIIMKNAAGTTIRDDDNVFGVGVTRNVATYADMLLIAGITNNEMAVMLGYHASGDGGGNTFYWSSASSATHNAIDVIKPTAVSGVGRWIAVNSSTIIPEQAGVKTDGSDCTSLMNALFVYALANNKKVVGTAGKTYFFNTADLNMRRVACDFTMSKISVSGGFKLIIGGNASSTDNATQQFGYVTRSGGATSTPTIQCIGSKCQRLEVRYVDYMQLYADTASAVYSTDYSIAYSVFNLDYCNKLELATNPANVGAGSGAGSVTQWINENTFNLKRTNIIIIDGSYAHNNNVFNGGGLEGGSVITINKGYSNLFRDMRFEGGSTITFATGTWDNEVIQLWSSSRRNPYDDIAGIGSITISDSGIGNQVIQSAHLLQQRIPLLSVNTSNCLTFSNVSGSSFTRGPNFTTLANVDLQRYGIDRFTRASNRLVFDSPLIPVSIGDCIEFAASHALFRSYVRIYDSNKALITDETVNSNPALNTYLQGYSGLIWDGVDRYKFSNDSSAHKGIVINSAVAYIKWDIMSGGASSGLPFDWLTLELLTYKRGAANHKSLCQRAKNSAASASPVIGFASEIGTVVNKTGANGGYNAVMALDTDLSASASGGASTVTLTSVTGLQSLDIIGITLDTGQAHWTTVNGAPVGNVVTLTVAMPSASASGSRVVANRWA